MPAVLACAVPPSSLLHTLQRDGVYMDAYCCEIDATFPLASFVSAFYTTRIFKLERLVLAAFVARPSTDAQAHALGLGTRDGFAAWAVIGRTGDQLLMRDISGRTCSWLMVEPREAVGRRGDATRLYFGSAVLPRPDDETGQPRLGALFHSLLGFHRLYSRVLLRAAHGRLRRMEARASLPA